MAKEKKAAPETREPELYNSSIIDTCIKLIRRRYNYINIPELLEYAGMESYQVEDESHWFTQSQVDRFMEKVNKLTGNPHFAKEAGRFTASPETFTTITKYLLGFVGPAKVFEMAEKITKSYTRSTKYESKRIGRNEIEIKVTPYEGTHEKPYQCENRIGYFEAILRLFNYRLPKIEHPECMFEGGKCCRYIISWQNSPAAVWRTVRNVSFAAAAAAIGLSRLLLSPEAFQLSIPVVIGVLLVVVLYSEKLVRRELFASIENLRSTSDRLLENVSVSYNHALMINEIGQTISKQIQIDSILEGIGEVLKKRLDYDRGLILLANREKTRLEYRTGFGYAGEQLGILKNTGFHLDNPDSRGIFVVAYKLRRPFLINDVDDIRNDFSTRSLEFVKAMGGKSFICVPIVFEDDCLGILAVDNVRSKRPLLQSDINLLMGIAPEIAISIHNAFLIEEQERQFRSVLRTLAASIDARDFLTAGHSERVTEYSVEICRKMGLSREYTEMIRVASQLHDYGKIGIQDSILKKAGPLSYDEREEIKTHVEKTESILSQISFEGIYREVPSIAGAHHERMDGSGYPRGLKGEEIPLGSRIIAVADFFEAITAKRHYRDPMPYEDAIRALHAERGKHLDARVVDAFLDFLKDQGADAASAGTDGKNLHAGALRPQHDITGV